MKKNLRFRYGKDANKMLLRQLLRNFIIRGKITTTRKKAKFLKSHLERVLNYAKKNSQATQNKIKSILADNKVEKILNDHVTPVFKEKTSGFTKIIYLSKRESDSSDMARVEWSLPVVLEKEEKVAGKKPEVLNEKPAEEKNVKPKKQLKK